jgi:hypothetical protein
MGGRVKDKIHIIDCKRVRVMGNLEKLELLMEMMEEWGIIHKDGKNYFPTGSSIDVWSEAVAYQASLDVSSHDDCVDALVWLCNGLMTRGKLELEY